ncbi:ATP-dependent RNA helicase HrpA [Skermania piniformis]|uniref:ATP-dependent RNA helicase HrpA n=1 Tax=Skermania pinensis TaxID=39122 RepID=A0ABX8SCM9_9ACTN|nr:ATP-dependent RNA helicase HrpA [Skermania piniformis]QXQ15176.1 ATP-dependent RNA helicase HrpA [Skermania piniformis]
MSVTPSPRELRAQLSELTIRDEHRLRRRLDRARDETTRIAVATEIAAAATRVAERRTRVPDITYPPELPVSAQRDEIAAAIAAHQVVIVAGETGSGKTTQLPKICLELGRGVRGVIGHTQPRRIAARTVAERIAAELHTELGGVVGYTVRFTDRSADHTLVRLMTDGILLAEIQRDRLLRRYDTIIVDEAHERSLNIDFLLGYLKQLLPRRPDLKVVVTSATIDPELFARHFATDGGPAPIVEVSGRTYPVEIRYRPLTVERGEELIDRDPVDAVGEAVRELFAAGDGDVLVFLSGEREIRDTADALRDLRLPRTEILPLYARLSAAEQHRVFERGDPKVAPGRRVVLATNVAETSLTVPGIRYVIDPGTARISRYSMRTKVQRLPIEPISQASARQRAGRCGRVADGICIRLYSENDYAARPAFTEPEIHRTNLAAVVLRMAALELGRASEATGQDGRASEATGQVTAISEFPFVEPPDVRNIRDGVALLTELGAIRAGSLTAVGRQIARVPVDPRLARMLYEGQRTGCLREVSVIVAGLAIQDVRERPADRQQAADAAHARFTVPGSDFLAYRELWTYLREQRNELSSSGFRRMCKAEFLHWLRIREWQDLHGQLGTITRELGWTENSTPATDDDIHRALLAGLLSHIGVREAETREFLGARGAKFAVFPGSTLARKPPRWVMAAELVETSRLWARTTARIEPEWAEALAGDLVKRSYSEPHWSARRAAAAAYERVTLFGVPLVARRAVDYAPIDPAAARELFLRHALVHGEWSAEHAFLRRNRDLIDDLEELENRARRRDLLVDDERLFEFYDARVPADVVSGRHFDRWWKTTRQARPTLLDFTGDTVRNPEAAAATDGDYPDAWRQGELTFPLTYRFDPGTPDDGVTVRIPVAQLGHVRPVGFDWLVPGMRVDLATALVRTLPKTLRRRAVPAPDVARAALAAVTPRREPIRTALARELSRLTGAPIAAGDLDPDALPDHLRMTFVAVRPDGTIAGSDKDLTTLTRRLGSQVNAAVTATTAAAERAPTREWTDRSLGTLPATVRRDLAGQSVTGYPALVAEPDGVAVRVLTTAAEQAAAMLVGTRTLVLAAVPTPVRSVTATLTPAERLTLAHNPDGDLDALIEDCRRCAADELIVAAGGPVREPDRFADLLATVRPALAGRVAALIRATVPTLIEWRAARRAAESAPAEVADDVIQQLENLMFAGFVTELGAARLTQLPRYLRAIVVRLAALPGSTERDRQAMATLDRVYLHYDRLLARIGESRRGAIDVVDISWMIEELRVSLFAQQLGTAHPVSEQRIIKAIGAIR